MLPDHLRISGGRRRISSPSIHAEMMAHGLACFVEFVGR
jgi:hypothetical protein